MPSNRRNYSVRRNVKEGTEGNILEELVWKYGVGDTVPVTFGAGDFDSGLTELPGALTVLTADSVRLAGILLCNITTSLQLVNVTNTAGRNYLKDFPLQARMTVWIPLGNLVAVGVKWGAGAAASVNAQLVGDTV